MEQSLADATAEAGNIDATVEVGNIDALYGLLRQNPYLLEKIDKIPFVDTPLHTASSSGSTHLALEVLTLKPSFGRKLNPDGFSPLDLALLSGQTQTVRRLVDHDPELVRVKGKEGFTPLHYVAQVNGAEDLLALFLLRSPKAIEDVNIRRETTVHVAVRNRNVSAFKVILGWLQRTKKEEILNWEDEIGNTVLHIATSTNNYEVARLLIHKVKINHKNQDGLTALDIAMGLSVAADERIKKLLRSAGGRRSSKLPKDDSLSELLVYKESLFKRKLFRQRVPVEGMDNLSGDTRNAFLVVAVLVATATYQAILSPPGGLSSGGDSSSTFIHEASPAYPPNSNDPQNTGISNFNGKVQMEWPVYSIFLILNTIPFFASLGMIVALLPKTSYNSLLVVPLLSLSLSYGFSAGIISPRPDVLSSFSSLLIPFCVFVLTARSTTIKYHVQARV